jgi:hypothetical protein
MRRPLHFLELFNAYMCYFTVLQKGGMYCSNMVLV